MTMTSSAPGANAFGFGTLLSVDAAIAAVDQAWKSGRTFRYGGGLMTIGAVAASFRPLSLTGGTAHALVLLFPATILVAMLLGAGPGIFATFLSAACCGAWTSLTAGQASDQMASNIPLLLAFVITGVAISGLCGTLQRHRQRTRVVTERAFIESERHFTALVEAAEDCAIFMLDPVGRVLTWNAGAQKIKGWAEREITGKHFSLFFPEEAANRGEPERELRMAADGGSFHEEAERVRKDGVRFWADVALKAIRDADGKLQGYTKVTRDITARVQAAHDRLEHQWRMTSIIESAMDAVITVRADQRIVLFNKAAEIMFQAAASDVIGQDLARFIPARARDAHPSHIRAFGATGVTSRGMGCMDSLSALRSNGEEFPIEASVSQAHIDGSPLYTVILRDITQRKRAEERQSLLLLELAHRAKNTLAIVQSIVAQTRRFASPDDFQEALTGRLIALGTAQDLLTHTEWAGATLADIVRFALAPHTGAGAAERWAIAGPAMWLASNEAVTLSLVFHELATNAAKYGALSDANGSIAVDWELDAAIEPASLTIRWLERGGPTVSAPTRRGFGSRLLEQAVAHELHGETALVFSPLGAECRLRLPLSQKVNLQ